MVRTYQKKNLTRKWSEDDMKAAMEAVKNGQLSVSVAAKHFSLPRETLQHCVTNQVTINAKAG